VCRLNLGQPEDVRYPCERLVGFGPASHDSPDQRGLG
jgi:hypothetical protein